VNTTSAFTVFFLRHSQGDMGSGSDHIRALGENGGVAISPCRQIIGLSCGLNSFYYVKHDILPALINQNSEFLPIELTKRTFEH